LISFCSLQPSPAYIFTFLGATINYTFLFGLFIFIFKDKILPFFKNKVWMVSACLLLFGTALFTTDFPLVNPDLLNAGNFYKRDHIYIYNSISYLQGSLFGAFRQPFFLFRFMQGKNISGNGNTQLWY
jgi:hypothetical protein